MVSVRIPVPREHGAWAMLLTSLALGQAVAWRINIPSLYLWLLTIAVFIVREPLVLLWRPGRSAWSRRTLAFWAIGMMAAILLLAGALLATRGTGFLFLAVPAAVAFALQLTWQRTRASRSLQAELLGTAGTALAAPTAYFAATGVVDSAGLSLWPILFAYFAAQVAYVRWRVRAAGDTYRGLMAVAIQFLVLAAFLALSLSTLVPPYSFVAFVPGLAKTLFAVAANGNRIRVTRLGWIEVLHSLLFFVLAILAFRQA